MLLVLLQIGLLSVMLGTILGGVLYLKDLLKRQTAFLLDLRQKIRAEVNEPYDVPTVVLPAWRRTSAPLAEMSPTLEHRLSNIDRSSKDHYPFALPHLAPMTPLPDVMREPPRISRVVMRANDWIESRDQYGFVMPQYSGLWRNVGLDIMDNFDGEWLVPKDKTGYHNITRFKRVRPQDYKIPPLLHPRDLPEIAPRSSELPPVPPEESPIA